MIPRWRRPSPGTRAGRASAPDDEQVSRGQVENVRTVLATHDDVLDPGAVPPLDVDPGLDAERHPDPERLRVPGHDVRVLVALEPDPVPRAMEEARSVAGLADRVARRGIDRLARDAGSPRRRRRRLRRLKHRIQPLEL